MVSEEKSDERLWLKRSGEGGAKVMTESERREKNKNTLETEEPGRSEGKAETEEGLVWRGGPVLWAFYHFYLVGFIVAALGTIAVLGISLPLWVGGILYPFVAFMFALPLALQQAWAFTIMRKEVRHDFRLFVVRSKSAPIDKVTDVTARQGVAGRIFGFGTVRIDTAGTSFPGVSFWGIKDPFQTEKKVRDVVDESKDEER